LVLPVFAYQINKIPIERKKLPPIPLYMLMWEYGFVNSYLELDETMIVPKPIALIVKFTKDVLENKNLTISEYHSLNDRLVSSSVVDSVWSTVDHVFYRMPMAINIIEDVIKIIDSKYTRVSSLYKKMATTPVKKLPDWPNNPGHMIMKYNMPAAILKRHKILREELEKEFGVRVSDVTDLFRKFSFEFDIYYR